VKAGDDRPSSKSVQKYRRADDELMFRMATAAPHRGLGRNFFLRVYPARAKLRKPARIHYLLYRIATNLAVNMRRDTRHERPENTVSL